MRAQTETPLAIIDPAQWDALERDDDPFLSYAYLSALEDTGQVGPETRWQPCHITLRDASGALLGALPLYRKSDSWGEFVFDFAWANAYAQAGRHYYPKLVTAVPYTPVGGRRLLLAPGADRGACAAALIDAAIAYARERRVSSWHVQFCHPDELEALRAGGLLLRQDCQFHWFNAGYANFDDYLATFRSARRKKTRRERRRVAEQGIGFEDVAGDAMSARRWATFYDFYASSFEVRGRTPYFTPDFFERLGATLGESILIKFARRDGRAVAAAMFLHNARRLYGRYWGCRGFYDALHFETCYYQGIDWCIENGIAQFDPGTQGEHKIARGFRAHPSWSAHYLADADFSRAIADYLQRERAGVRDYMAAVDAHLPFREPG